MSGTNCVTVSVSNSQSEVNSLSIGLSVLFGLLGGIIMGILILYLCWKDPAGKKNSADVEVGTSATSNTKNTNKKENRSENGNTVIISQMNVSTTMATKRKRKLKLASRDSNYTPVVEVMPVSLSTADDKDGGQENTTNGMVDALMRANTVAMEEEMLHQDVEAIASLQREFKEESIMTSIQLLRVLLSNELHKGSISKAIIKSVVEEVTASIEAAISQVQVERDQQEQEIKKTYAKDKHTQDEQLAKLDGVYSNKLNHLLAEEQRKMRGKLRQHTQLSDEEIEAMLRQYDDQMAGLDKRLETERIRQLAGLEDRLSRRKRLAGLQNIEEQLQEDQVIEAEKTTATLVTGAQLSEKQKHQLLSAHQQNVQKIKVKHKSDFDRQKLELAEKLRNRRKEKLLELKRKQEAEKTEYHAITVDQMTETDDLVQTHHTLENKHRTERDILIQELDQGEATEMKKLTMSEEKALMTDVEGEVRSLLEKVRTMASLSETDFQKLIRRHEQEMESWQSNKDEQRHRQEAKLLETIAKRRQKVAQEQALLLAEQAAFKKQQDSAMKRILEAHVDLTDKQKQRLLEEHQSHMVAINNQLELSRQKQHKQLQEKMASRRATLDELKRQKKEIENSNQKAKEKALADIENKIQKEEIRIESEKKQALNELRKRLAEETNTALHEDGKLMGERIARLQVLSVRRNAAISNRQKILSKLESQLMKKLDGQKELSREASVVDLYNQYQSEVHDLEERVLDAKLRQREKIREKLESRQLQQERVMQSTLQQEAKQEWEQHKKQGTRIATDIMSQMLLEQRFKNSKKQLQTDLKWEMERSMQKIEQQLELEVQDELMTRKQKFLTDVAVMSNMSKEDLRELLANVSTGDEEQDALRRKELLKGLKKRPFQERPSSSLRQMPEHPVGRQDTQSGFRGRHGTKGQANGAFLGSDEEF